MNTYSNSTGAIFEEKVELDYKTRIFPLGKQWNAFVLVLESGRLKQNPRGIVITFMSRFLVRAFVLLLFGVVSLGALLPADALAWGTCPYEPQDGRIIIEFFESWVLRSDQLSGLSKGPLAVSIPAGTYDITLVSWDNHSQKPNQVQDDESWFLQVQNADGDIFFASSPISDIPQNQNQIEELVNENAVITQDIAGLIAHHIKEEVVSEPNSLTPRCAVFDLKEILASEFSILGHKFHDQNENTIFDGDEQGLESWTINISGSEDFEDSTITDELGHYSFDGLFTGFYTICEEQQEDWKQTFPENNECYEVEIVDQDLEAVDFGNVLLEGSEEPLDVCPNIEDIQQIIPEGFELIEGECVLIEDGDPPTGDDDGGNGGGGGGSTTGGGGGGNPLKVPALRIDKTVSGEFTNPGGTVEYTVVITNIGPVSSINTILVDTLPAGFSHEGTASTIREWELGEIPAKGEVTITYEAAVGNDVATGDMYINVAEVRADRQDPLSDDAVVAVRGPSVKAAEAFPVLQIQKAVDTETTFRNSSIIYTVTLKNVGEAPAVNVFVLDTLPSGFYNENRTSLYSWQIPLLNPGETWKKSVLIIVSSDATIGIHENLVVANAENHGEVRATVPVQVLYAGTTLPDTGDDVSPESEVQVTLLEETSLEQLVGNYLVIPKIGVHVEIVEGEDASSLAQGAWRLPGTSTPDRGGNTVVAAHRFRYAPPYEATFYYLDKLETGDEFSVFWEGKEYRYQVVDSHIVAPTNLDILNDTPTSTFTMVTCSPLFSTSERLIVSGELISIL